MIEAWTSEWPDKPGWFWFYGHRSSYGAKHGKPELFAVSVKKISNGVMYVADGHFIFEAEGAVGKFAPMIVPESPTAGGPT